MDSFYKIINGDAFMSLAKMDSNSVNCCVTSPPYWGLRDYGVEGQMGMEPTITDFIAAMADVFIHVLRVLRPDGTCWINMGDAYTGGGSGPQGDSGERKGRRFTARTMCKTVAGMPAKNLIGQPWRLAFALQSAGWILRSEIIWHKPNPMPEAVYDRPTRAHEHIFLLTKTAKYHYDYKAIQTPLRPKTLTVKTSPIKGNGKQSAGDKMNSWIAEHGGRKNGSGANKRTVWPISSRPFKGAHFATFPEALVEPCILAGCPAGGIVLDPFTGSGTTGIVAIKNDRKLIGIELNSEYCAMANQRCSDAAFSYMENGI